MRSCHTPRSLLVGAAIVCALALAVAAYTIPDWDGRVRMQAPSASPALPSETEASGVATRSPSLLPPSVLADATVYVANDGDDAGRGTADDPFATVQRALDAGMRRIEIGSGTYPGFHVREGGSANEPLVIGPAPDATVVIEASEPSAAVVIGGARHVVLRGMTVRGASQQYGAGVRVEGGASEITIEQMTIRENRSFGIEIVDSRAITVRDNLIERNDTGIRLIGRESPSAVGDVLVEHNEIRHNAGMVVNDHEPNNDFGANGIIFHLVDGGVVVRNNLLFGHRAESIDYGSDGGAFEVWGASNLVITDNVMWDNENVMETGTPGEPCSNITFTRNVAYNDSSWGLAVGMILRCASDSLVAHNTFDGLDWFTWELSHDQPTFGGSIMGLRIVNNIVVDSRAYVILNDLPETVVTDHNLLSIGAGATAQDADELAHRAGGHSATTLGELRGLTGNDAHSIVADPAFVDRARRDYRLTETSPAVDAGLVLDDEPFAGDAPDIGRFELDSEGR